MTAVICLTLVVLLQLAVIVRLIAALVQPMSPASAAQVRTSGMTLWARRRAKQNPQTNPDEDERRAEQARQANPIGL